MPSYCLPSLIVTETNSPMILFSWFSWVVEDDEFGKPSRSIFLQQKKICGKKLRKNKESWSLSLGSGSLSLPLLCDKVRFIGLLHIGLHGPSINVTVFFFLLNFFFVFSYKQIIACVLFDLCQLVQIEPKRLNHTIFPHKLNLFFSLFFL